MRPLSVKVPAPVICTSDSKVARGPGLDSALAWTPFAVSAVRRTWPAAVVLAASFPSTPSTGWAFPLNCNANTSSFIRSSPLVVTTSVSMDRLGQVLRRVGLGRDESRCQCVLTDRRPTLAAELLTRGTLVLAPGTLHAASPTERGSVGQVARA